ncbi:hypothetical protein D3C73_1547590 [compost metagenome]
MLQHFDQQFSAPGRNDQINVIVTYHLIKFLAAHFTGGRFRLVMLKDGISAKDVVTFFLHPGAGLFEQLHSLGSHPC